MKPKWERDQEKALKLYDARRKKRGAEMRRTLEKRKKEAAVLRARAEELEREPGDMPDESLPRRNNKPKHYNNWIRDRFLPLIVHEVRVLKMSTDTCQVLSSASEHLHHFMYVQQSVCRHFSSVCQMLCFTSCLLLGGSDARLHHCGCEVPEEGLGRAGWDAFH